MSADCSAAAPEQDQPLVGSDGRYYRMLLDNNYISDLSATKSYENFLLMEHSYSRDWRPLEGAHIMTTRTIMVHRPPQCPSCHIHTHEEGVDMNETYNPPIPTYNEDAARIAMLDTQRVASVPRAGTNQDSDHDWEDTLTKGAWTRDQAALFAAVSRILDLDRLARLANAGRLHEPVLRRVVIDKSVARLRKAVARFSWQPTLMQWLHALLVDHLPATYMAAYLDIMQTLRAKVPTLVDSMMRLRPAAAGAAHADLLAPVLQPVWEPCVAHKNRKLPGTAPVVVVVPSSPVTVLPAAVSRQQRWHDLLGTMGTVVPVLVNLTQAMERQSVQSLTEHMVAITRVKVQELRNAGPAGRHIVLVGFNAGAALALQVAMVESVNSVVCMGFAHNTLSGVRGTFDDRILDLTTPVMFVLGQNAARSSQEEIESVRERMQAQTSLVVVGSADDALRVGKTKRQIEGVTQAMVDNMIIDEVSEFAATCIINPPAPRDLHAEHAANAKLTATANDSSAVTSAAAATCAGSLGTVQKKRRGSVILDGAEPMVKAQKTSRTMIDGGAKPPGSRKVGRPRNLTAPQHSATSAPLPKTTAKSLGQQPTAEALNMAIQSILPPSASASEVLSTFEVQPNMVLKPITVQASGSAIRKPINAPLVLHAPHNRIATVNAAAAGSSVGSVGVGAIGGTTMQKIKMLPGNQFVRITPPSINAQKLYTLGGTSTSTNAMATSPKQPMYTIRNAATTPMTLTTSATTTTIGSDGKLSKVYTVKSTPTGTQLLSTPTTGQHLFGTGIGTSAVKQMITVPTIGGGSMMLSPKKFTLIKQQQHQHLGVLTTTATAGTSSSPHIIKLAKPAISSDLTTASIFDMPIVFADNEGNIPDGNAAAAAASAGSTPLIISHHQQQQQQQHHQHPHLGTVMLSAVPSTSSVLNTHQPTTTLHNRNITINTIAPRHIVAGGSATATGNKVVLINRPMKGAQSIQIGGGMSSMTMLPAGALNAGNITGNASATTMQKFTKVNVSNASSISLPVRTNIEVVRASAAGQLVGGSSGVAQFKTLTGGASFTLANKVDLLSNAVIRPSASVTATSTTLGVGAFNVGAKTATALGQTSSGVGSSGQFNPIVISVDSDKTTIKNIIKVGDTQIRPTNTIVLKPGTLRPMLKPGILNRHVTVRKVHLTPAQAQHQQLQMRAAGGMVVRTPPPSPQLSMASTAALSSPQGSQIVLQSGTVLQTAASATKTTSVVAPTSTAVQAAQHQQSSKMSDS